MNVSLTPELENIIQEKIATGLYHSAHEVIQEGLLLLKQRDEQKEERLQELRKEIALGIEQADRGEFSPLNIEQIKAEGHRRLAEKQ